MNNIQGFFLALFTFILGFWLAMENPNFKTTLNGIMATDKSPFEKPAEGKDNKSNNKSEENLNELMKKRQEAYRGSTEVKAPPKAEVQTSPVSNAVEMPVAAMTLEEATRYTREMPAEGVQQVSCPSAGVVKAHVLGDLNWDDGKVGWRIQGTPFKNFTAKHKLSFQMAILDQYERKLMCGYSWLPDGADGFYRIEVYLDHEPGFRMLPFGASWQSHMMCRGRGCPQKFPYSSCEAGSRACAIVLVRGF